MCFDSDAFKNVTEEFWYRYFWWSIQQSMSHIAFIFSSLQMMKIGGVLMDFVQTTDVNMIFYRRSRRGAAAL